MPSTTKILLAGLMAATAVQAKTTDTTLTKLSGTVGATGAQATVDISAVSSSQDDNNAGGASTLAATVKASVALVGGQNMGITLTPAFTITTKACKQLATSPTVSLTVTLALPAAMKTAINTMITAANGLTGTAGIGITVAQIEAPVVITVPFAKLASFKLSEFAPAQFKLILGLTGSDIVLAVKVADMAVYAAGNAIPLTATLTVMDPTAMTLPLPGLCETGKPSVICGGSGIGCNAMCLAVKVFAPAKYEQTLDFAKEGAGFADKVADAAAKKLAKAYFVKCGAAMDKDCFSIGDTSKGKCAIPTTAAPATPAAAKSGASTAVVSAVVAGASLMMALMM